MRDNDIVMAFCALFVSIIVGLLLATHDGCHDDCADKGGVWVRGAFTYVCVPEAR